MKTYCKKAYKAFQTGQFPIEFEVQRRGHMILYIHIDKVYGGCVLTENLFNEHFEIIPEKPPLGLTPAYIWKSERQSEILEAISRYVDAKKDIPYQWIAEYWELGKSEADKMTEWTSIFSKKPEDMK